MVDEFQRSAGTGSTSEPADDGGSDPAPDPEPVDDVQRVDPGAPSGGSVPEPDPAPAPEPSSPVDRVRSTIGDARSGVDRVTDSVGGTVSDTIDTVSSGVDEVSETLPGPTGTAFATGVGVAAVPEPTPVTETTGAAIAGGAALVGGGVLASRAIQERGGELEIGERVRSELGVGQQNQDVTEVGVGEQLTSEVGVGESGPSTTEVGLGSTTTVNEIQVGTGDRFGSSAGAAVGAGTDTDDGIGPTIDAPDEPSIERDIDESGGSTTGTIDRDPVRFPANEGATGTAPGVIDQQVPDFDPTDAFGLGTATGAGGLLDPAAGGTTTDGSSPDGAADDVTGTGTDPSTGAGPGSITDPGTGTGTDPTADPGAEPTAETLSEQTAVGEVFPGAQTRVPSQPAAEATPQQFAEPTAATFATEPVEVTESASQPRDGQPRRDPERPGFPGDDDTDEPTPFAFATNADRLDSGILGGDEAVEQVFGDGRGGL